MSDIMFWPQKVLTPADIQASPVPFTRSGGRSLGGLERTTRTDKGYWSIALQNITLHTPAHRRTWNAIRTGLNGRTGLIAVPVRSRESAPWPGAVQDYATVPHSDQSTFSDGSEYRQRTVLIDLAVAAAIGDTVITLRRVSAVEDLTGIRFSYRHAFYETGAAIDITGDVWQVPIFPAIRAPIPIDAELECDLPTCLCKLASDNGMDMSVSPAHIDRASVAFVEACDYWSDLALA